MRSVLLFRIKNCRCSSMAISPLKILIIFEIWSLGSGFFTYKQKDEKTWEPNYGSVKIQFMKSHSGMFPSPYSKIYQVLGLKERCFCPCCTSPNLPNNQVPLCTTVKVGEETLWKEMYSFIESKRMWVTSDILQAAVWPYRYNESPARGNHFYKCEPVFPWKF